MIRRVRYFKHDFLRTFLTWTGGEQIGRGCVDVHDPRGGTRLADGPGVAARGAAQDPGAGGAARPRDARRGRRLRIARLHHSPQQRRVPRGRDGPLRMPRPTFQGSHHADRMVFFPVLYSMFLKNNGNTDRLAKKNTWIHNLRSVFKS